MVTYIESVVSALNGKEVTVRLLDGNSLVGKLNRTHGGQVELIPDTGKPYYVNGDNVLWIRQQ